MELSSWLSIMILTVSQTGESISSGMLTALVCMLLSCCFQPLLRCKLRFFLSCLVGNRFFFRVANVKEKPLTLKIVNAGEASYPEGWYGYNACCSYDRRRWFRVPTSYDQDNGHLTIKHIPEHQSAYYAYFAPYSLDAHMHLIAQMQLSERSELVMLGETLDGHDLDLLVFGKQAPEKKKIWVIARQHPGETMAEWFAEGMLGRLADRYASAKLQCCSSRTVLHGSPRVRDSSLTSQTIFLSQELAS